MHTNFVLELLIQFGWKHAISWSWAQSVERIARISRIHLTYYLYHIANHYPQHIPQIFPVQEPSNRLHVFGHGCEVSWGVEKISLFPLFGKQAFCENDA